MRTEFFWGWKNYTRQPDKLMTRERMARLMRAWRRAKRNLAHGIGHVNKVELLERMPGARVYRVTNSPTGEVATFEVRTHA